MSEPAVIQDPVESATRPRMPFERVLCGIDGSRPSREALRQAIVLARDGRLDLLSVAHATGAGPLRQALLDPARARAAMDDALAAARAAGLPAAGTITPAARPAVSLLERSLQHDLLVLGTHGHSRAEAILVGTTAGIALHRAHVPVLVARTPPSGEFPGPVVVATSARRSDRPVIELAARVAAAAGQPLTLLSAGAGRLPELRDELSEQYRRALAILGTEPYVSRAPGHVVTRILAEARANGAALVVTGSSSRHGLRAVTSVSERVGAHANCSVLVVRG